MATRAQKIKVGVFLFVSMAFLVILLVLISGMERYPTEAYQAIFQESVIGLDKGGEVRYNGVLVGQVEDILIGEEGNVRVILRIRKDKLSSMREGMIARLAIRGVTGIAYVELSGAGTGEIIPPMGTIPTELSFISNVTTNFPLILETLNDILVKLNTAMGDSDTAFRENVENLINQINGASSSLSDFADEASTHTRSVSLRLNSLLSNLDSSVKQTQIEVNRVLVVLEKTVENMDQRMGELDLATTQRKVHMLSDQLSSTTLALEAFINNSNQSLFSLEYSMKRSLDQLHSTLTAAESLIKKLERDPSVIIHGERKPEKRQIQRSK